jgi:hypothetical protein
VRRSTATRCRSCRGRCRRIRASLASRWGRRWDECLGDRVRNEFKTARVTVIHGLPTRCLPIVLNGPVTHWTVPWQRGDLHVRAAVQFTVQSRSCVTPSGLVRSANAARSRQRLSGETEHVPTLSTPHPLVRVTRVALRPSGPVSYLHCALVARRRRRVTELCRRFGP